MYGNVQAVQTEGSQDTATGMCSKPLTLRLSSLIDGSIKTDGLSGIVDDMADSCCFADLSGAVTDVADGAVACSCLADGAVVANGSLRSTVRPADSSDNRVFLIDNNLGPFCLECASYACVHSPKCILKDGLVQLFYSDLQVAESIFPNNKMNSFQ